MSGVEPPGRRWGGMRLALLALLAVGAAAVLYVIGASSIKPGRGEGLERYARGSLETLRVPEEPRRAPTSRFADASGRTITLADLPGEVLVVNLWATWCAPCVAEMPTLAALQRAYGPRVHVAAVSLDRVGDQGKARAFLARHAPLGFYHDPSYGLASALKAQGLPATIIYGADRVERARVLGPAEWGSPEARRLFDALLAESPPKRGGT